MQSPTRDAGDARHPESIGPFSIGAEIARGQLATIYLGRARGVRDAPPLAIKRVRAELSGVTGWGELIADEATLLSSIDHPNVMGIHGAGDDGGSYVALEYVEGESLERLLLMPQAPRTPPMIVAIVADALRGLAATHAALGADEAPLRIVHQAPRPRHILVAIDGRARLADFTQASARTLAATSLRRQRLRAGSMAPEHTLDPRHVDFRADIFIMGMTLWEVLTGRPLFEARASSQTPAAPCSRYPKPSSVGARPPDCFDAVCLRALERDPQRRFASADEMLSELLTAAQRIGGLASPPQVAQWVHAALAHRPPAQQPHFPAEASGSYRKPEPGPSERASPLELAARGALELPASVVTQELFASPPEPRREPLVTDTTVAPSARFAKTMDGLSPLLALKAAAAASGDRKRDGAVELRASELRPAGVSPSRELGIATTISDVRAPAGARAPTAADAAAQSSTSGAAEQSSTASTVQQSSTAVAGQQSSTAPAGQQTSTAVAAQQTSTAVAAQQTSTAVAAQQTSTAGATEAATGARRVAPATARPAATASARPAAPQRAPEVRRLSLQAQRERRERMVVALLTAALVATMLVIGDALIRKLLPAPELPTLEQTAAAAPARSDGARSDSAAGAHPRVSDAPIELAGARQAERSTTAAAAPPESASSVATKAAPERPSAARGEAPFNVGSGVRGGAAQQAAPASLGGAAQHASPAALGGPLPLRAKAATPAPSTAPSLPENPY